VLTQSLSVAVLEVDTEDRLAAASQSAISDAIVNAEAFSDIAGVTVAMGTDSSASAVVCICQR